MHLARNLRRVKRQIFLQHIEDSKPVQFDHMRNVLMQKLMTEKDVEESVTTTNNRIVYTVVQPTY